MRRERRVEAVPSSNTPEIRQDEPEITLDEAMLGPPNREGNSQIPETRKAQAELALDEAMPCAFQREGRQMRLLSLPGREHSLSRLMRGLWRSMFLLQACRQKPAGCVVDSTARFLRIVLPVAVLTMGSSGVAYEE